LNAGAEQQCQYWRRHLHAAECNSVRL